MYEDALEEGDRVSLANLPIGRPYENMLSLTMTKKSLLKVKKKKYVGEEVLNMHKSLTLCDANRSLLGPCIDPSSFRREFDVDCYLLKTVTSKNKRNQNLLEIQSFIVLTPD